MNLIEAFQFIIYLALIIFSIIHFILHNITITCLDDEPMIVTCNETTQQTDMDSDEVVREVENFENRPKSNLDETKVINLGDTENVKEMRISIHQSP